MSSKVRLHNLCCEMELRLVAKALDGKEGIVRYKVNMLGRIVEVRYVPSVIPIGEIVRALNEMNLGASVKEAGTQGDELTPEEACRRDVLRMSDLYLLITETFLILWYQSAGRTTSLPLWLAIIIGGTDLLMTVGARAAKGVFAPDMQTLMLMAITGASLLGSVVEAAVMLWLISASHLAEHSVLAFARANVEGCGDSLPMTATLAATGEDKKISELRKGDRVIVRAGESIPVDGVVVQYSGHVDESAVTGESLPKKKTLKSTVIAGTLVLDGLLVVQITANPEDSTATLIQDMVESAASTKTPTHATLDVFASYYTTLILLLALSVVVYPFISNTASAPISAYLHRALVLIVLGCPCALVTAGPIVTTCGIAANAKRGVLIKTADALEALASLSTVCFDKTGTLTDGHFRVISKWERPGADKVDLKRVVSLEAKSTHPLAVAVVNAYAGCMTEAVEAMGTQLDLPEVEDVQVIEGKGMRCVSGGKKVMVGSKKLLTAVPVDSPVKAFMDRNDERTLVFGMVDDVVANSVTTVLFDKQLTFKDLCKDPSLVELRMADDERPYACRIPAKLLCDVFGANAVEDFRGGETLKFAMIEMDQGTINKAIGSRIRTMDGKKQRDKVTRVKGELMEVVERSDEGLYDALEIDHCFWEVLRPTLYILSYTASLDEPLQKLGGNDDLFQGLVAGVRKLATEKDTILRSNIPNNDKEAALEAAHTVFRAVDRLKLKPSMQTTLVRWGLENLREEVTDPQPVGVQDQAAVAWERKQHKLQHQLDVMQCMPVDEYIRNKKHDPNDDPW
eukprot:TRINITY_DN13815_c0_g1_i1.p1 TRINITY_DN13815_c0_g1~~TRINITY_DN13815_c0_g1_i1.p1  ORF type:complete len:831 (+),score=263.59 TRINITY_DN13815_c0_g1_i1:104-2494(+)